MPILPREILKSYFLPNDRPTSAQFAALVDSMVNISEDGYLIGLREYNPLRQYFAGDTTIFSSALYECIANTTGPFNPTSWNIIASLGSVTFVGAWDAIANTPKLTSGVGTKGFYYVVSNASSDPSKNTTLDGINTWGVSDWAVFDGTKWEKVGNSGAPIQAQNVIFAPNGDITATDVQNAIVQVRDHTATSLLTKMATVPSATDGHIGTFLSGSVVDGGKSLSDYLAKDNAVTYSPSTDFNPATKKYVDDLALLKADKVTGATANNFAALNGSGDLIDSGFSGLSFLSLTNTNPYTPTNPYNPATKSYVDSVDLNKADKVTGAVSGNFAALDGNGDLTDSHFSPASYLALNNTTAYTPSAQYNPATKGYVDGGLVTKADKVSPVVSGNFAGLNVNGDLTDSGFSPASYLSLNNTTAYTPSNSYNPATKIYVDQLISGKTDKVANAVLGHFPALDANGNLTDSGYSAASFLALNNSTPYTPTGQYNPATKGYADNGDALKADKVTGASAGNFAGLNGSGDLTDSGFSPASYLSLNNITAYTPSSQYNPATKGYTDSITGPKANKVINAVSGNFASLTSGGDLMDSNFSPASFLSLTNTTVYTPTNNYNPATKLYADTGDSVKADKVLNAIAGHFATLDTHGNLVDAGVSPASYLATNNTTAYTPTAQYNPATKGYVDSGDAALKVIMVPFVLDAIFSTKSGSYVQLNPTVTIPKAADIYPGTTTLTAKLIVDYRSANTTTAGQAALLDLTDFAGGPITPVTGSPLVLPQTNGVFTVLTGSTFTITGGKSYNLLLERTTGSGNNTMDIEGASLVITYQ